MTARPIATVAELIEALGGIEATAVLLGVREPWVYQMRRTNKISPKHVRAVSRALPRGYDVPYRLFTSKKPAKES